MMATEQLVHAREHVTVRRTRLAHALSSLTVQLLALVFLVGLVLWTLLFTSYAPLHDPLHALRHALYLVPCH
ncbi:MAG: hypothetical protein ACLGI5_02480 [Thermoleophilia bacterium]